MSKARTILSRTKIPILAAVFLSVFFSVFACAQKNPAKDSVEQPVTVNGDIVEYFQDTKDMTASGNVRLDYKGTKMRCDKLKVNTQTKDATAEGHVRIEDKSGVMLGEKIIYNFDTRKGTLFDADFMTEPYYGRSPEIQKVSDQEFISLRGYTTSCNYDSPHYRLKSKKVDYKVGDKIQTKSDTIYIGKAPLGYLPFYNHSLKDPMMHVQLTPGYSKKWGAYMLSAWRYNITGVSSGRVYLDWRDKKGLAHGFGFNHVSPDFGKSDFKYYYLRERPRDTLETQPGEFQRYFVRWRHQWDIDTQTSLINEYYKIGDSRQALLGNQNIFLKEYFFREYEKDPQPLSYTLLHHSFEHSSADILFQKRINRWYGEVEKLPEVKYSLPNLQIGESPFYFDDASSATSFNSKNPVPSPAENDVSLFRADTTNRLSLPMKLAFISFTPFAGLRNTIYDRDINQGNMYNNPRNMFLTGADLSTKFYRIFDVNTDFWGLDINSLRHVITPTVGYIYNHRPTIPSSKLKQFDSVDSLSGSNSAALSLSNKLQTKRDNKSVDFVNFLTSTSYLYKPKADRGSRFGDILFDLELLPYSWMSFGSDATFKHSGGRSDVNYRRFSNINYDLSFNFAKERAVSLGERFERKGARQLVLNTDWRLSPKWKVGMYERYQLTNTEAYHKASLEQEYRVSRDLHCWTIDVTLNIKRHEGRCIWFIFRLKAFPETEFSFDHSYDMPKPGAQ